MLMCIPLLGTVYSIFCLLICERKKKKGTMNMALLKDLSMLLYSLQNLNRNKGALHLL